MKLADLPGKAPMTVAPGATIVEAAELMERAGTGSVMVVDDGRLVGIVTDRDVVVEASPVGRRSMPGSTRSCRSTSSRSTGPLSCGTPAG